MEIFSQKSLNMTDWCAIAETCKRFRTLIQRVIPKYIILRKCDDTTFSKPSSQMKRLFCNFGSVAKGVSIEFSGPLSREAGEAITNIKLAWDFIRKYRKKNSTKLEFLFHMNGVLIMKIKPFMMKLSDVDYFTNEDKPQFMDCNSLVHLNISNVKNDQMILKQFYPKLKHFVYEMTVRDYDSLLALRDFISRHSTVKSIFLWIPCLMFDGRGGLVRRSLLRAIGKSCKKLEKLKISIGETDDLTLMNDHIILTNYLICTGDIYSLRTLTSLRTVTLSNICDSFKYFSPFTKLHELTLNNCILPQDFNDFRYLAQLRKLSIFSYFSVKSSKITLPILTGRYVVGVISVLINLNYLKINGGQFVLDEPTFCEIAKTVRKRLHMLNLACDSSFENSYKHENYVKLI